MSARKDYAFPAAVADGRVNGGAYGRLECANALDEIDHLRDELARVRTDYEAQLEAVHDLTETLAEERVQHAAQVERLRVDLLQTSYRLAEWHDALGAVVPELEREMTRTWRLEEM